MFTRIPARSAQLGASILRPRLLSASQACHNCRPTHARYLVRSYSVGTTSANSAEPDIYDVVCVGGGPAGLSLLAALRANPTTAGLRVALVEAQDLSKLRAWSMSPEKFSNRCSSLTPASAEYLDRIGAWSHLKRERVQEYQEMQVWDGVSDARIEFDWEGNTSHTGDQTIAFMTENLNLTQGLLSRIDQLGQVSIFDGAKVVGINYGEKTDDYDLSQWPVVNLSSGQKLWARLLVGADGANSPVRTFANIETRGWDYGRHGVVATVELEGDGWGGASRKTAYQRFLPTGPMAMLPLPGHLSTLVWSTTPERAAFLKRLAPRDFVALVNAGFSLRPVDIDYMHTPEAADAQQNELDWRLQHTPVDRFAIPQTVTAVQEGTVASFPLKLRHADTYIAERVALVGDAAHSVHPLAGQGLNQGQGDVQTLVRSIETAVLHGQDIGSILSLESYNAERYAANHVLMGVCDKLHKLYSFGSGPIVPLRSIGLTAVNALRPLKNFFMEKASGSGAKLL
ncbi:hypothetical protein BROUX41_006388 [Berkeleyomyces rouxiae]